MNIIRSYWVFMATECYYLSQITGLNPNEASNTSAHPVHFVYYKKGGKVIPIVFKENKHGKALASVRETAFSELAKLVMVRHLTPPQHLVIDEQTGQVVGTAVDNISLSIMQREKAETPFFDISNYNPNSSIKDILTPGEKGTFQFLNKMPDGFFAHLMRENKNETLSIDMESLASVLTGAYTLEEDDLHKRNIGFYVKSKKKVSRK